MITLTIEDKQIEHIFLDEDWSYLEDEIQKGLDSGKSGKKHREVFSQMMKKFIS